ncbi:MAG: hypothetical protein WBA67_03045 [Jannaschia sp.]
MKAIFASALIATAALTGLANAQQVAPGAAAAIAHFNESKNTGDKVQIIGSVSDGTTVSTRSGDLSAIYGRLNADVDAAGDLRGQNGATVFPSTPAYGADVFARLEAEKQGGE